jgi:DNA repair protein RadC
MMRRISGPPNFGPFFQMIAEERPTEPISSAQAVFDLLKGDAQADREWLQALYLGPKNNVVHQGLEGVGTIDSSAVYPREIAKRALCVGASAVILAHNHPSGDPEPSLCDREVTRNVLFALRVLQIKLLDHIIIGARVNGVQRFYGFADQGLIDDYDMTFNGFPR